MNIEILYISDELIACVKPAGVLSEKSADGQDIISLLEEQVSGKIYPLHRLDRPVGGVMIFARTPAAAAKYTELIKNGGVAKSYLVIADGVPDPAEGEMCDLLFKDSRKNKVYVVKRERRGVKKAALVYKMLRARPDGTSLLLITLKTGRSHQIRAQLASRGMPVSGDGKYGSKVNRQLALWSCCIELNGMKFIARPDWADDAVPDQNSVDGSSNSFSLCL